MRDLLMVGASGLAREAAECEQGDFRLIGLLDDDETLHGTRMAQTDVLGGLSLAATSNAFLVVCIGIGSSRRSIVGRMSDLGVTENRYATLVDASVRVPSSCTIGPGSILLAGAVLTANVTVGRHVVVMPNVVLTHDNKLEDYTTLAAGVSLGGAATIGTGSYVGMNASVHPGVTVGAGAVIGMGAVVLRDVPENQTWVGVPARDITARPRGFDQ